MRNEGQRSVGITSTNRLRDVFSCRYRLPDPTPCVKLDILDQLKPQGVRHRDGQHVLLDRYCDARVGQRQSLRDATESVGHGRVFAEVCEREPQLVCQDLCDLALGGEVHPNQHGAQALARPAMLRERLSEVGFAHDPRLAGASRITLRTGAPSV